MTDLFSVRDKVVLITGSTRGLGRTFAQGFAEAGARVVINGRSTESVDAVVAELTDQGFVATGAAFDVSDEDAVAEAVARVVDAHGAVDVLVNNAGIQRRAPLGEMSIGQWREVIETNLTSVFLVSQAVVRASMQERGGSIVNISSLNSFGARPTIANYCSAKSGLNGLTRSMATEWGNSGIRTNSIAPGYFLTDMTRPLAEDPDFDGWVKREVPLARWGNPDELIGAAIFLASDASSYVNGHVLFVDGGWSACL